MIYIRLIAKDKGLTSDSLLTELKDRFHRLIEESKVLGIEAALKMEDFFKEVSDILAKELNLAPQELLKKFLGRERGSSTVNTGIKVSNFTEIIGDNLFSFCLL